MIQMLLFCLTPSHIPQRNSQPANQTDLTTMMEALAVAGTGLNLKVAAAASSALVVVAESEVEVEHMVVEGEVELTVLNLRTF